jgi:hypothetical protein
VRERDVCAAAANCDPADEVRQRPEHRSVLRRLDRNADGSFDMVFGYFNRNWEEQLSIPAGPDNMVEPGGPTAAADVLPAAASGLGLSRPRAGRFRQANADVDHQGERENREKPTAS